MVLKLNMVLSAETHKQRYEINISAWPDRNIIEFCIINRWFFIKNLVFYVLALEVLVDNKYGKAFCAFYTTSRAKTALKILAAAPTLRKSQMCLMIHQNLQNDAEKRQRAFF